MSLTVMSFNIRCACDSGTEAWEARVVNLVPLVKKYAPDLIGFQEVTHKQYLDLVEHFPEYGSVGVGREDGENDGERASIFYKKDRFTLLTSGNFWLSETPDTPSFGWNAACIRICTFAKFLDNKTQKEFVHFNTHLDHVSQAAQYEGAKLIRDMMLKQDTPAFVTGDFNIPEQSAAYKVMTGDGLVDAKYAAIQTMSHGTFHGYRPGGNISEESPIDYLFLMDGKYDVKSYEVLVNGSEGKYTSDHYPVLVELCQ
ncbi:MAG: endonuclease/exonuclease/phosphatase family protein [Firmicutes bacterium]|nr:endonuclease/exonuclease/phosphatase family protein [Bacillota bacterium]